MTLSSHVEITCNQEHTHHFFLFRYITACFPHTPPADVSVRAGRAADHHEPGRHRVAHPGGPQQPHHHAARRDHGTGGKCKSEPLTNLYVFVVCVNYVM